MRVLYVTWGETPRLHGVYKTQVCNLLMQQAAKGADMHLFSAVPFVNSALVREKDFADRTWGQITRDYALINPVRQFTWAPQPLQRVLTGDLAIRAPFWGAIGGVARHMRKLDPDIVHCRSYLATHAAIRARAAIKSRAKIIFDMRGFFPEEILKHKGISDFPPVFDTLKQFERSILDSSDAVAVLNQEMWEAVDDAPAARKHIHYPPVKLVGDGRAHAPAHPRRYLYVGAIGDTIWHTQTNLVAQFKSVLAHDPDARLCLATGSPRANYQTVIDTFGHDRVDITLFTTELERTAIYRDAAFGLLPYTDRDAGPSAKIGQTLLGTKTVEYLCEGLPVIVHPNCRAAARIVTDNDMGLVCTSDLGIADGADMARFAPLEKRQSIMDTARKMFALNAVADGYMGLYDHLMAVGNATHDPETCDTVATASQTGVRQCAPSRVR